MWPIYLLKLYNFKLLQLQSLDLVWYPNINLIFFFSFFIGWGKTLQSEFLIFISDLLLFLIYHYFLIYIPFEAI